MKLLKRLGQPDTTSTNALPKWHRTSRPEFREEREQVELKSQERRKRKKRLKQRSLERDEHGPFWVLQGVEYLIIFSKTPTIPPNWEWLLPAVRVVRCPYKLVCMSRDHDAPPTIADFLKAEEADSYQFYVLHGLGSKDKDLEKWVSRVRGELSALMGWNKRGGDD